MSFFRELPAAPEQVGKLFSHILNAHHLWNCRIEGVPSKYGVWQIHDPAAWEELHEDNQRYTFTVLTQTDNFNRQIDYESVDGEPYTNTLQDILFHIINHATHHRGQIASELRREGIPPIELDYIFFKR